MGQGIHKILENSYPQHDNMNYLVIHQVLDSTEDEYSSVYKKVKAHNNAEIIISRTKGLSLSRNIALSKCKTDFIIFSDDDNSYNDNLYQIVTNEIKNNSNAHFFSFIIGDKMGGLFKDYKDKPYYHTKRTILRLSSIENCYDMSFIKKHSVRFDEMFGLGSLYPACEQPIFASDLLSKGAVGMYLPHVITYHPKENSGHDFYSHWNVLARKYMFIHIYGDFLGRALFAFFITKKMINVPRNKLIDYIRSAVCD